MLSVEMQADQAYTALRPEGDLDSFGAASFRQVIEQMQSCDRLLIDLSRVTFLDSAGLGSLIAAIRRAREVGASVALCCDRPPLVRLLRTTGFDRIVHLAATPEEAVGVLVSDAEV